MLRPKGDRRLRHYGIVQRITRGSDDHRPLFPAGNDGAWPNLGQDRVNGWAGCNDYGGIDRNGAAAGAHLHRAGKAGVKLLQGKARYARHGLLPLGQKAKSALRRQQNGVRGGGWRHMYQNRQGRAGLEQRWRFNTQRAYRFINNRWRG
jgi:hypothetical protein